MSKKKVAPMSREQLEQIDHGDLLWTQLNEGTQIADPELQERIEIIRDYLLDVFGRMTSGWMYDDEEGIAAVINWAKFAFHYRQALQIAFADMKGYEVDEEDRVKWAMPFDADPIKSLIEEMNEAHAEEGTVH